MIYIRRSIFRTIIYLSFLFLGLNLFYMQLVRYPFYRQRSQDNRIRIIPIESPRGVIYDRNGNALVNNRISFDLAVIPQETGNIKVTLESLSKLSGIPQKTLYKNYRKNYLAPFLPTTVEQDLDKQLAFFLDENIASGPGAIISANLRRDYLKPEALSHITGYIGKMDEAEYKILKEYGYKIREYVGKTGIEKQYNSYLRGEDGGIQVEVDASSRQVKQLGYKTPQKGKDLYLTIDLGLQEVIAGLMEGETGACIVTDTRTGEVLALVSSPGYDPNSFVDPTKGNQRAELLTQKNHPMLNRAISSAYPPGSIFKIVVSDAALSSGKLTENMYFTCNGAFFLGKARFGCWKESGHGSQNVVEGLTHSCNVFFYNTGKLIGPDLISQYASKFGLGQFTYIDLPLETNGLVPSPLWKRVTRNQAWQGGDTLNFAIGQGDLLVSPIQALRMVTIVANKGFAPRPYLVKKIGDLNTQNSTFSKTGIFDAENEFDIVQKGLYGVVNSPTGTGQLAKHETLKICGKTGTAQVAGHDPHAWFVGYAPYENPRISFVVFLEHGVAGGIRPARMAGALCKYMQEKGYFN